MTDQAAADSARIELQRGRPPEREWVAEAVRDARRAWTLQVVSEHGEFPPQVGAEPSDGAAVTVQRAYVPGPTGAHDVHRRRGRLVLFGWVGREVESVRFVGQDRSAEPVAVEARAAGLEQPVLARYEFIGRALAFEWPLGDARPDALAMLGQVAKASRDVVATLSDGTEEPATVLDVAEWPVNAFVGFVRPGVDLVRVAARDSSGEVRGTAPLSA